MIVDEPGVNYGENSEEYNIIFSRHVGSINLHIRKQLKLSDGQWAKLSGSIKNETFLATLPADGSCVLIDSCLNRGPGYRVLHTY
jgi:hypothetical protein